MTTRAELVTQLSRRLGSVGEARWMVEEVLGRAARPSVPVDDAALVALSAMADRRTGGEPLQYVLGTWAFRTLDLVVDERALIPRPETEQVVEVALAELARSGPEELLLADLGTGSGAIALALAAELGPRAAVWATDVDEGALALAEANRARVGCVHPWVPERVRLRRGSWFGAMPEVLRERFDLVVANPPYVAAREWASLDDVVRHEPYGALVAADGTDGTPGFASVEEVVVEAAAWLAPRGALVVELAPSQAVAAAGLAARLGYGDIRIATDLAGRDRALVAHR